MQRRVGISPVGPFEVIGIQVDYGQPRCREFVQILLHDRRWVLERAKGNSGLAVEVLDCRDRTVVRGI